MARQKPLSSCHLATNSNVTKYIQYLLFLHVAFSVSSARRLVGWAVIAAVLGEFLHFAQCSDSVVVHCAPLAIIVFEYSIHYILCETTFEYGELQDMKFKCPKFLEGKNS